MRRARRPGWIALALFCAGCASDGPGGDHWGVRRETGSTPAIVSLSEVNVGSPEATGALVSVPLLERIRGPHRVAVQVEAGLAPAWSASAARVEPELLRALDWLERIAPEGRGVHLQATLLGRGVHREERRRHAAGEAIVVDLLVPVDAAPPSRSAAVSRALALALHEAVHALRTDSIDRAADEYRASLVEACYLLDTARVGDAFAFAAAEPVATDEDAGDFTARHSREAAGRVLADLARVAGGARIAPGDVAALRRARAFCRMRLALPAPGRARAAGDDPAPLRDR